jgi:hypothetical protein
MYNKGANMEQIQKVYQKLSGVDIEEQKRIWDERGKGYYGEYLDFEKLFSAVRGHCKLLMNLQVPTLGGKTTEIDLLMVHETGIYVFEIKHYKGTIYGQASEMNWTQYFRTVDNSKFANPILQNDYHIAALRAMFPDAPIYNVLVFTHGDCNLQVEDVRPDVLLTTMAAFVRDMHQCVIKRPAVFNVLCLRALLRKGY